MKKILLLLALLFSAHAQAAVTFVSSTTAGHVSATSNSGGTAVTPTSGNDLILVLFTSTTGATLSSVVDSHSATVIADVTFAVDPTNNDGFGVYRIHNVTDGLSHYLTATFTGTVSITWWLVQASGVGSFGANAGVLSGSSVSLATNSLSPAQNGALLIAFGGVGGGARTFGAWTNGFTLLSSITTGPSVSASYLNQATAASVSTGSTLSSSANWSALLVSYLPTASATPTNGMLFGSRRSVIPFLARTTRHERRFGEVVYEATETSVR